MKRIEIIFLICISIILVSLFFYGKWRNQTIEKDGVYVIAKIYKINEATNGFDYFFRYRYLNMEYENKIGSLNIPIRDSLIVLQIARKTPAIWKRIDKIVPECLLRDSFILEKQWAEFPDCKY